MATRDTRRAAFDLDGAMIDSRRAVEEAYRRVGIVMPDDAWGKPGVEWLPALTDDPVWTRALKNQEYVVTIHEYGQRLAGAEVFRRLRTEGVECWIVTAASRWAAMIACDFLDLLTWGQVVSTQDKALTLRSMNPVCHVDDRDVVACPVPLVKFVDNADELEGQIRRYL